VDHACGVSWPSFSTLSLFDGVVVDPQACFFPAILFSPKLEWHDSTAVADRRCQVIVAVDHKKITITGRAAKFSRCALMACYTWALRATHSQAIGLGKLSADLVLVVVPIRDEASSRKTFWCYVHYRSSWDAGLCTMLKHKGLIVAFDLDHTLVEQISCFDQDKEERRPRPWPEEEVCKDPLRFSRTRMEKFTVRPHWRHLRAFLHQRNAQVYICTRASKENADLIWKLLNDSRYDSRYVSLNGPAAPFNLNGTYRQSHREEGGQCVFIRDEMPRMCLYHDATDKHWYVVDFDSLYGTLQHPAKKVGPHFRGYLKSDATNLDSGKWQECFEEYDKRDRQWRPSLYTGVCERANTCFDEDTVPVQSVKSHEDDWETKDPCSFLQLAPSMSAAAAPLTAAVDDCADYKSDDNWKFSDCVHEILKWTATDTHDTTLVDLRHLLESARDEVCTNLQACGRSIAHKGVAPKRRRIRSVGAALNHMVRAPHALC
jgi:hypothetical protein